MAANFPIPEDPKVFSNIDEFFDWLEKEGLEDGPEESNQDSE